MSLDWRPDWRAKSFGLPARGLPKGYRSDSMQRWAEENTRAEQRERALYEEMRQHVQQLAAQDRVERQVETLDALVHEFGSEAVETLQRHYYDPYFRLPHALRDIKPREE